MVCLFEYVAKMFQNHLFTCLLSPQDSMYILFTCPLFLVLEEIQAVCHFEISETLRSSHYAVTHVRYKNSNNQGSSPNVVKVVFHSVRNCS